MSRKQSPFPKKPLAIKRADGEPLTRVDLQYDFLLHIFSDDQRVFTDPYSSAFGGPAGCKVSFRDLYVNAIMHSTKATKALKDSMSASAIFATDFAMLALLANVGRVNTTMSFFAEKKTAVRTYHPIPALQRADGNLQDAPRIKGLLKACTVPDEDPKSVPTTPGDILTRATTGKVPPTSIATIIFILSNYSPAIGQEHFLNELEFIDLFLPVEVSSASRARAFLWLCYHFHEATSAVNEDDYDTEVLSVNPFCDSHRLGKAPAFVMITRAEAEKENVDTEEEIARAEKSVNHRNDIINKVVGSVSTSSTSSTSKAIHNGEENVPEVKAKSKRNTGVPMTLKEKKERKALWDKQYRERVKNKAMLEKNKESKQKETKQKEVQPPADAAEFGPFPRGREPLYAAPSYRHSSPDVPSTYQHRYAPYKFGTVGDPNWSSRYASHSKGVGSSHKSMLDHAWHVINCTDPLLDSDDEPDDHVHRDYSKRLRIIARVRGKEPTPEPELYPVAPQPHAST
ncbi:uncharacterized protein BT62DRAFT_927627 [Guyanagaster necrorhizus]|uniref:Ino eighty subunit 1 n=1 Tax=Guyanagaster necrorhizus TaxID=856835 RepID=A0A9P7W0U0_9AGAR|nr:uncharacterized protein BT62DRAFT_927627 [Guyanagaster necrorhizus MCA 3950]KAG7450310.1 hypothetical protein BT62DRAFT_927627 [Guyanagaster necrorhizus MCA 3950]